MFSIHSYYLAKCPVEALAYVCLKVINVNEHRQTSGMR
jgi:hypothetical protein